MNDVQLFANTRLGVSIRAVEVNGVIMFIAKDLATSLQYKKTDQAIRKNCKHAESYPLYERGQVRNMKIIPQSDIFRLIMRSKMPEAEEFQDWVVEEVLPTIANHGIYATDSMIEKTLSDPDYMIGVITALKQEREQRKLLQEENTSMVVQREKDLPKIEFSEAVMESSTTISIGDVAKVLNVKNVGQNRLFAFLRYKKVLITSQHNRPYQQYVDCGYFKCIVKPFTTADGKRRLSIKTVVFQRGVDFIRKLLNQAIKDGELYDDKGNTRNFDVIPTKEQLCRM